MSATATALIKLAAREGLLPAEVARAFIGRIRASSEPQRLAEELLVQGGHCSPQRIAQLCAQLAGQDLAGAQPPTMIGGFQIIDRLGAGGMGEVYRAKQLSMHRIVALKLLSRELVRDAALGERFLREARAAGAVSHPNVVGCYDVGIADGRYFMALEYVSGGDAERLTQDYNQRLGSRRAVEIVRDCACGLQALHGAGFVHRDVKPSNILLTEDGVAKVGDLGLVTSVSTESRLTQSGLAMGTPAYMSPEQADGDRDLDPRTDVYSLGASLYYLLTGHKPFTGQSVWAVVAKVINDPFPDPRRTNPEVSAACAAVVLRATAKDRTQRYQSARELQRALEDLLAGDGAGASRAAPSSAVSLTASTMSRPGSPPRAATGRTLLWQIGCGIAVLLIAVQAAQLLQLRTQRAPAASAPAVADASAAPAPSAAASAHAAPPPPVGQAPPAGPAGPLPAGGGGGAPAGAALLAPEPHGTLPAPPGPPVARPAPAGPGALERTPAPAAAPLPSAPLPAPPAVAAAAAAATPQPPAKPVIAILGCEAGDATLRDFAKAFPELLTVSLSRKATADLVERTQLRQVLTEQELTQSGAIDSSTAARIGHLIGARVLVLARVYAAGDFTYVSAKAIDVESGRVKAVSKGDLRKDATPALMAAAIASELTKAIDALAVATPSESAEAAALVVRLDEAVRGQRLPSVVIAVEETMLRAPASDPAVRTELGYLLRKTGFRVIESDSPALATWAKDYASGRTSAFPTDLGAVEVVVVGSGVSDSAGTIGALSSARARLELSAIAVGTSRLLAVERATVSALDASETLAGKTALEKAVRQIAPGFVGDLVKSWNGK